MLTIYGSPLSSPTNKVRYTANFLNMPFEFRMVNLRAGEQRSAEFLKINPFGKIPAIDDNGFTLGESNAIIRYLTDKKPSALYPQDLKQRANVDQWLDYAAQHIAIPTSKIMFNTYFYKLRGTTKDERSLQDGHDFLKANLPIVEQQLTRHPFVTGNTMTLADIALLAALDVSELAQVDLNQYPHINAWRKKLMNEAFYKACHSSYTESFNQVMSQMQSTTT